MTDLAGELRVAMERLPTAEIAFARFNAARTSASADAEGIASGTTAEFAYVVDRSRPGSDYYNRAFARGDAALSPPALAALPAAVVALEVRPADLTPATSRFLLREGFAPRGQLCYLARRPAAVPATAGSVERLAPSRADEFLDLLALQGVDFPPERRDAKRGYYSTDRFQAFVARGADGAAHGWATMFVSDGSAFFGNSYTLPAFRKRGAHGSLLAARLTAASDLGLEIAFTDVEHRSASHDNCERAGFRTLTINTIWSRGPGA